MTPYLLSSPSNPAHLTHPKYRSDINGLRAIAILVVVGFHAFPKWVRGGFIGVDIFFVISGFLISTIIFENLESDRFSFIEFYSRRIKRIFPALLVVLVTCIVMGHFILLPNTYRQFGTHIAAGAGFVSNLLLWKESGYFDSAAETKPLLHLWSLGIEEQFYLIWPLLLWVTWKKRWNFLFITVIACIASFTFNIYKTDTNIIAAFYSPLTRFWELFIGSCLAYYGINHRSGENENKIFKDNVQSCLGIALLVIGLLCLTKESAFPGWWALLPTLGTAFIINAGAHAFMNRIFLSNRILGWFGLISYPLYLWHWPLLSFATLADNEFPSRSIRIALVALSVCLAWLTYILIERPVRFGKHSDLWVKVVFFLMIIIGFSGIILTRLPLPSLSAAQQEVISKLSNVSSLNLKKDIYGEHSCFRYELEDSTEMFIKNHCLDIKYPHRPIVFIIGDSHSAGLALGLRPLFDSEQINVLQVSTGWCEPTSDDLKNSVCQAINKMTLARMIAVKPELVIIHSHWFGASYPPNYNGKKDYLGYLLKYLKDLKDRGVKRIIVVGSIPTWQMKLPDVLTKYFVLQNLPIPTRTSVGIDSKSLAMDLHMRSLPYPEGISYISLKDILCDESGCLTMVGDDLQSDIIVWDDTHLTRAGSNFLAKKLWVKIINNNK